MRQAHFISHMFNFIIKLLILFWKSMGKKEYFSIRYVEVVKYKDIINRVIYETKV